MAAGAGCRALPSLCCAPMDSLSQFALGAAVGVAVMGRRTAVWKAALWGGVLGTLPDLDALIDHGDPVRNMVLHRAQTHALFWQTLAAVPVAAGLTALMARARGTQGPQGPQGQQGQQGPQGQQGQQGAQAAQGRWSDFPRWLLTVWLVFVTHALLDAMTVYGTQLALPFSAQPYGVGSIFIIDPLYTLPLLGGLAGTLAARGLTRWRWNLAGLVLSTAYLGWSAAAQQHVQGVVQAQLGPRADAAQVERVLVTPTAFNTVLWRVVLMRPDGYDEGFYSLLDAGRAIRYTAYPRDRALYEQLRGLDAVARIADFSRGFFRVDERDGVVRITDLRMGQEPAYVFSFAVARRGSALQPVTPPLQVGGREDIDVPAALRWLWRRLLGEDIDPPR
jgi:inner membrane protein